MQLYIHYQLVEEPKDVRHEISFEEFASNKW